MTKRAHKPLTPAVLHILLALLGQDRHGYAIMKQIEVDTDGKIRMGPGTLYGTIGRTMKDGLIEEGGVKPDPDRGDSRRIYYRLTFRGRQVLTQEIDRYHEVVRLAGRDSSPGVAYEF